MRRAGLSVTEVVLAALVIGVSAIPVLELMRGSTANLEVNQIDAVARGIAADVLERISGPPNFNDAMMGKAIDNAMGAPAAWDTILKEDPSLARGFPTAELAKLLDQYEVKLQLKVHKPSDHSTTYDLADMKCCEVRVTWKDREDRAKEVTFARLVEQ